MAYRYGDRSQKTLFPQSIDEYIPQDAPARAYDVFVDSLDFEQLGIRLEPDKVGCPQYDPKIMLKLLVYGYSYGIRSSRKLERETHYNLSFIWLTGGVKPDHKTIAQFRRNNKAALSNVLKQCARLCIDLGLIEGNTLFIDGSNFRANASIDNNWSKERCLKRLENIDNRISEILSECEQIDQSECNDSSMVKMKEELSDNKTLRKKVTDILSNLSKEGKESINATDCDCVKIHSRQGSHAGYNAQTAVDEKHGLIVSSDVVKENVDNRQFAKQVNNANDTLGKKAKAACADSGYSDVTEVKKSRKVYRVKKSVCQACQHFGVCTSSGHGRKVTRMLKEDLRQKLERQYEQPESQEIYKLRKQKSELPFGHIKHNLKAGGFLLRGLEGVKAEMSILSSCFNIARMISIIGVSKLIVRLAN
jgi:transposase